MIEKITDIEKALNAKSYLSALALTLTLPDICGKIAYPEIKSNGERYARWFDEYLTKHDYPESFEDRLKFDGRKCWKLRCAFLHEGSTEGIPDIDNFELCITESSKPGIYGPSGFVISSSNKGFKSYSIQLDVAQLCLQLYSCARGFYDNYKDKIKFNDHKIIIIDIGAEALKIRKMNKHLFE